MPSVLTSVTAFREFISNPMSCALVVVSCLLIVLSLMAIVYGTFRYVRWFRNNHQTLTVTDIEAQVPESKGFASSPDIPASIIKLLALSEHSHIPILNDALLSGPIPTIPRIAGPISLPERYFVSRPKPVSLVIDTPVELRTRRLLIDPSGFAPSRPAPSPPPPLCSMPVRRCPSGMWDEKPVSDWEALFVPGFAPTVPFAVITREKVLGLATQSANVPVGFLKTKYREKAAESKRIARSEKRGVRMMQAADGRKKIVWKDSFMLEKPTKLGSGKENIPTATHADPLPLF